jgi:hypothetical protein
MKPLFKIGNRTERPQSDFRTLKRVLREMKALGLIRFDGVIRRDKKGPCSLMTLKGRASEVRTY